MNKDGAIIIIEDDSDDQFVITEILKTLGYKNKVLFFSDGEKVLAFLDSNDEIPFLILSDRDMPAPHGLILRKRIQTNKKLSIRFVPFLFFASVANQKSIIDAYSESIQGFFIKPSDFGELRETIKIIIEYWKRCEAPNAF